MYRLLACAATAAALLAAAAHASAAAGPDDGSAPVAPAAPDAARVHRAADAFDAGAAAYKNKQYELAASRFEEADAAVPSPQALRQAIRARHEAGQGSRAATLAALALDRYPNDLGTTRLANDVLEQVAPVLHKVSVSCASPCVLAAGTRAIHGEPTTRWTVYLDPGPTTLSASLFGGTSAKAMIEAKPGGAGELRFEPGAVGPMPMPAAPAAAAAPASGAAPAPANGPAAEADSAPSRGVLPPLVFIGGAVVTAALGGVTIWSGVDTVNDPGADAVRTACAGRGTGCALYQDGLAKETRTNVLIGATAGAGALTLAALFLTDWGGGAPEQGRRVVPIAAVTDRGATIGAEGRF